MRRATHRVGQKYTLINAVLARKEGPVSPCVTSDLRRDIEYGTGVQV